MALNSLNSSSEALPASDSDMSADESHYGKTQQDGNRIVSLQQENRVLKMELEMYKLRTKSLQEENKALRQASVSIVSLSYVLSLEENLIYSSGENTDLYMRCFFAVVVSMLFVLFLTQTGLKLLSVIECLFHDLLLFI